MKKIYKLNFFFTLCVYLWLPYAYGAVPQKTSITSSNTGGTIASISSTNNVNPLLTTIHKLIKQGDTYYAQEHYPTAVAYYKEALQKYAQNYTGNDLLYALICNNLGVGLLGLKVYQQSYLCLHQALTIRHQYLSIDKPPFNNEEMRKEISKLTGESHYSLGCLYLAIGKHQEAIISFKAAMSTEFSAINTPPEMQLVGDHVGDNVGDNVGAIAERSEASPKETFACSFCDKKFAIKENMKTHMLKHKGENPYDCAVCDKKFAKKQYLKIHMRIHTGEKPFQCPVCHKKFSQKYNMKTHMRIHTGEKPFQCPICRKKFSQGQNIKIHMRIHTGEKPFQCPICDKKFAQKYNMKTHINTHTGEKPFSCDVCRKKFAKKQEMQTHVKSVHKK